MGARIYIHIHTHMCILIPYMYGSTHVEVRGARVKRIGSAFCPYYVSEDIAYICIYIRLGLMHMYVYT